MPELPKTRAQVVTSLTVWAVPATAINIADMIATLASGGSVEVGEIGKVEALEKFDRTNTRASASWRQLDYESEGYIQEYVPGLSTIKISVTALKLWTKDLPAKFGYSITDIVEQKVPFIIKQVDNYPGGKVGVIWYVGCWLHANSWSYDINGNLLIPQTSEIAVTRMFAGTVA